MTKTLSPRLSKIVDTEILTGLYSDNLSLFHGQMGRCIFFSLLSRCTGNNWYEDFSDELFSVIYDNINTNLTNNFANGLCGIGWGIEFLKTRGFISTDTDEILEDFDTVIMQWDPRRISDHTLDSGLKGLLAYTHARLHTRRSTPTHLMPFDSTYIADLSEAASRIGYQLDAKRLSVEQIWQDCLTCYRENRTDQWAKGIVLLETEK